MYMDARYSQAHVQMYMHALYIHSSIKYIRAYEVAYECATGSYFLVSIARRLVGRCYRFPRPFVNVVRPAARMEFL